MPSISPYVDSLADPNRCRRDIPYLRQLNTNVTRVYAADPKQDHDSCLISMADTSIYVISDSSDPIEYIGWKRLERTVDLLSRTGLPGEPTDEWYSQCHPDS